MPRVLFIQSGNVERAIKALDVVKNKVFKTNLVIDYLADDVRPFPAKEEIPLLDRFITLKTGLLQAMRVLYSLLPMKYDTVVIMFTREPGYIKHKTLAFLIRKKKLLIFNENIDCFFYEHNKMLRHFQWRWRQYVMSGRNRTLRIMNDSFKVIRNEGLKSFFTKAWNIINIQPRRISIKLKKNIGPMVFPVFDNPKVSIVIPVYNKSLYTMNCLDSILEHTPDVSYEVIVVDDRSNDNTQKSLAEVKNIKTIRSEKNQGFVESCNTGASAAIGEYIIFLNNDTTVTPRWLSSLAGTLDRDKQCCAVGSKLVYPDGRLQEAGGIIWSDARGWNYGKFQDPEKPEFNYVREVDYCSGAALMVRRSFFEQLGGFDKRYAPAYWEDTDLCFSVRKLGYKVLYQPAAVVIHYEGISAGKSTATGMKKHQDINTPKFIEKWKEELEKQFEHDAGKVFFARDRNKGKSILVIDHYAPTYDKDAGSLVMYSFLCSLVYLGYRVVFWPENLFRSEPYTSELQQMGIEVIYGPHKFENYMKVHGRFFDCALISRTHIAIHFMDAVREYVSKVIYLAPDYEYLRQKRKFELQGGSLDELEKIKNRENYLFTYSDMIITHNPDEARMIRQVIPEKEIEVIPIPINKITDMKTPFESRKDLLFVGSSHPPNTDAILFYANEIMPALQKQIPGIKLYVVGGNPGKKLKNIASESIILTGFVKELLPYFEKCRVFCAPLRYGAGVKGKVIDAMSYGLPIVTTPVGAEGLGVSNDEHLLIAEKTEDIVKAVVKLYSDAELWRRLGKNSKSYVEEHYSQVAFREKVKNVMERVLMRNA